MFLILFFLSSFNLYAQKLVVNIDNPNFRKMITAVPDFAPPQRADKETEELARVGTQELRRLLLFTGLFNIVSDSAYSDLTKKMQEPDFRATDMAGVNVNQWRTLSIESLTLAHVAKEGDEYVLSIRTLDISQGKPLLGKKFSKIKKSDFPRVIRRYADLLLKAYTGKSGIFASKLAFVGRQGAKSEKQIYVSDFDGSSVKQITRESNPHLSPAWSHDGRFLVYTSFEDGNPDLFIYELATAKKRKLSGKKGVNSGGNWSPNDKVIAFTGTNNGEADIFLTNPQATPRKLFIQGSGLDVDPTFSPNAKMLAYVSGRFGNPHLFVSHIEWTGELSIKITKEIRLTYAGWYNTSPAWTPESDRIAFAGYDKEIDRWDLFLVNPDGTKLERLTLKMGDNEHPSFSPNGQNIMFESNRTAGKDVKTIKQLYMMNRDGSSQRQIATGLYEAQQPVWGPQLDE